MAKRKVQKPPAHPSKPEAPSLTVHVLDQFTERDLETWRSVSADLDELHATLYYKLQPQRMRRKQEIVDALTTRNPTPFEFSDWVRIVDYRYANTPLSVVGSLRGVGGRFNIGPDTDQSITLPFPALYIGESFEIAFRERFQLSAQADTAATGLSPEDMALCVSGTWVRVRGRVERCVDVSDPQNLIAICKVLAKIKLPDSARRLMRSLKLGPRQVFMITSAAQLGSALQDQNWRARPTQFGIPSISQQFAELARSAGYEGIIYRSTKNPIGKCLALFTDSLGSDRTFVELVDSSPDTVVHRRLDLSSADELMKP